MTIISGGEASAAASSHEALGAFSTLHSAERKVSFILECFSGAQLRVTPTAQLILSSRWSGMTFSEISSILDSHQVSLSHEEVESVYHRLVAKIASFDNAHAKIPEGFSIAFTLLQRKYVAKLARDFAWAYSTVASSFLVVFIAAGLVPFLVHDVFVRYHGMQESDLFAGYGLFLISLIFHEIGHASACHRFGGSVGAIGVALYLVFPTLYSDVNGAWKLKRHERVIVDLGGSFFQLCIGSVYALAYFVSHQYAFKFAVLLILGALTLNLNPFFKFDGYWLLSDLLGIANLRKESSTLLKDLWAACRGRRVSSKRSWPNYTLFLLSCYSVTSFLCWLYFAWRIGAVLFSQGSHMTRTLGSIITGSSAVSGPIALQLIFSMITLAFICISVTGMVKRMTSFLIRKA